MTVRTRFAPSPTGSLHVGGARTALYCMLHARKHGGTYILRIEDTDRARSTAEATTGIQRDLKWLGLHWDEGPGHEQVGDVGPYFQSKRLELYDQHVQQLLDAGSAYEAWETREELDAMRRIAEANKLTFKYRRPEHSAADIERFEAQGRTPVVRMAAPGKAYTIRDRILGEVVVPADDLDDVVIRKADGFPTYHFAVVLDDYLMEVSLVLRGQEHLMNTAKHLMIYEAFGWDPPDFAHLPLIFNPTGGKMSKRDKARAARKAARDERAARDRQGLENDAWHWLAEQADLAPEEVASFMNKEHDRASVAAAVARVLQTQLPMIEVMDFRKGGVLPEALANYLALLGWSPGDDRELMTLAEMQASFSLDRVNKTAARFDPDKLRWMNGEYMRSLPIERLQECLALWLEVADSPIEDIDALGRRQLLELYRPRAQTFAHLDDMARFFFVRPVAWEEKACRKHLLKGGGVGRLVRMQEAIGQIDDWTVSGIEAALLSLAETQGWGMGKLAQPLRVAITGTSVSPGIFETLAYLDRDEVLTRIRDCLAYLSAAEAR